MSRITSRSIRESEFMARIEQKYSRIRIHVENRTKVLENRNTKNATCAARLEIQNGGSYGKPFWTKAVEFFSDDREFSRTVENFLGRSRIFSDGREFSRTVENFLGRSRIFSDDREFSRTVENFLGLSRIFSNGREFSRTVENFLGRSMASRFGQKVVEFKNPRRKSNCWSRRPRFLSSFSKC